MAAGLRVSETMLSSRIMQVKVFSLPSQITDEFTNTLNEFLSTHDVIQNGIVVREDQITVMYVESLTDEERKLMKLTNTLKVFEDQYVEAVINHAFYLKLEMAGRGAMPLSREVQSPLGPQQLQSTVSAELAKAKVTKESVKAQILVVKDMIAHPEATTLEDEPSVFNQKQYKPKDAASADDQPVPFDPKDVDAQ